MRQARRETPKRLMSIRPNWPTADTCRLSCAESGFSETTGAVLGATSGVHRRSAKRGSDALASGSDPACRTMNFSGVPLFTGSGLIGDEAVPVVVNAKSRKPNEVGPNEVYIGRATRNGWRK